MLCCNSNNRRVDCSMKAHSSSKISRRRGRSLTAGAEGVLCFASNKSDESCFPPAATRVVSPFETTVFHNMSG